MKLLLDTHCWLWWFAQPERLSEDAIRLTARYAIAQIADETNELWFSVASIWENHHFCMVKLTHNSFKIAINGNS